MSVAAADLAKAINAAWDASTLDATFKALWSDPTSARFVVLNDEEAAPSQPFPYVVMEQTAGNTRARMSGGSASENREIRDLPVMFRVYARKRAGDSRTAKGIAADMTEAVMAVFGGHPTTAGGSLTLDNGNHLITQYQTDYPTRTGDDEWQWTISYLCRLDVPVAV